jgi:nitrogen fixation NifU-like protein
MTDLRDLYQELIVDHSKKPRNHRKLEGVNHQATGYNPLCGDRFSVYLNLDGDIIRDISFEGSGCAISTASASIMTETLRGKTKEEAETLFDLFHKLVTGQLHDCAGCETPAKLAAFAGVSEFPARVKCAILSWYAFKSAISDGGESVSTE